LDLGCGNGYFAGLLAQRGYRVTGVERPGGTTGAFPPTVRLVEADLDYGLPGLDDYFDIVVCADILEHLRDPFALLQQIRTVLAPRATVVASLPNSGHIYFRLNILFGRFPQHDKGLFDRTHLWFLMWNDWVNLFERAGFRFQTVQPTATPFSLAFSSQWAQLPLNWAETLSYLMARVWKRLFAYQFIVVAGRF
jgi:SAM-dependent methyltransferase